MRIWITILKLIKFSCIWSKYNTLQQKLEEYGSLKIIKWNICRDKKKKIYSTCKNL